MKHKRKPPLKLQILCNQGYLSAEMDPIDALNYAFELRRLGNDNIRLIPVGAA